MRTHAGKVAVCRRKRSGNALRIKRHSTEICSTQADCTLLWQTVQALSSSSGTVGNGLRAHTPATPETSLFPGLLGNTTRSSCAARWYCAVAPASRLRAICVRPAATSFRRRAGSSREYVWQPDRAFPRAWRLILFSSIWSVQTGDALLLGTDLEEKS